MRFAHLSNRLYGQPLLLLPSTFEHLSQAFQAHLSGAGGATVIQLQGGDAPKAARPTKSQMGRLAVIPLSGVIDRNLSMIDALCTGACDIDDVSEALREADEDDAIDTVVLFVDSPGGNVSGIPEAAALFRDIGTRKNTGAYIAGMGCSGGYYMASQAGVVACEPSSVVGSIGVISTRTDLTSAMNKAGVKVHILSRGSRKADGHPAAEMSDDEKDERAAILNQIFDMFSGDVLAARPDVAPAVMESGIYIGQRALDVGLVDGLCSSLDEFCAELLSAS